MAKSYSVAVLGNHRQQGGRRRITFGLQVFDLPTDKICALLENPDTENGVNSQLGVEPRLTYQLMGGGRFWPSASREEVAKVMQGVEVLVLMVSMTPRYTVMLGRSFYRALIEENVVETCEHIILRASAPKEENRGRRVHTDLEGLMKRYGVDNMDILTEKLCVISDLPLDPAGKFAEAGNSQKDTERVRREIATLRLTLVGEEVRGTVTQPLKETVTAGKSLLELGQRMAGWIGGMVSTDVVAASAA